MAKFKMDPHYYETLLRGKFDIETKLFTLRRASQPNPVSRHKDPVSYWPMWEFHIIEVRQPNGLEFVATSWPPFGIKLQAWQWLEVWVDGASFATLGKDWATEFNSQAGEYVTVTFDRANSLGWSFGVGD